MPHAFTRHPWRQVAPLVLATLLLAGCGQVQAEGQPPGGDGSSAEGPASPHDPVGLVDNWQVSGAGEDSGLVLTLGVDRLYLWRSCGELSGSWQANSTGDFVAQVSGQAGACRIENNRLDGPTWLMKARAFRVTPSGAELLDDKGAALATLRAGGRPTPGPHILASEADRPTTTPEVAALLRRPDAPLPDGLTPASEAALLGRWRFIADKGQKITPAAYVEFERDGDWRGSDGCNGQGGRWALGADGALLSVSGGSTAMACDDMHSPALSSGGEVRRAGLDGDELVLVDAQGHEVERLRR